MARFPGPSSARVGFSAGSEEETEVVACALEALVASGPAVCGALVAVVASHRSPPLGSHCLLYTSPSPRD